MNSEHKFENPQSFTKYLVDDSVEAIRQSQKQLDEIKRVEAISYRKRKIAIIILIVLGVTLNVLNLFGFLNI